jgi:hypothetical protein
MSETGNGPSRAATIRHSSALGSSTWPGMTKKGFYEFGKSFLFPPPG